MDYSFAYLVGIAFWIYLFTVGSGILADRKQRGVWAWALLGFVFGPFAFVTILLLGPTTETDDRFTRPQPYVPMHDCPHCLAAIPARAVVCRYCQRDLHAPIAQPSTPTHTMAPGAVIAGHAADCACRSCFMRWELLNRQGAQS